MVVCWVLLQTLLYQKNPEAVQLAESVQFPGTEQVCDVGGGTVDPGQV